MFGDPAKAAEQCNAKLYVILGLLFRGHLSSEFRLVSKQGFASLMVPPAEIRDLLASPPDGVSDEVRFQPPLGDILLGKSMAILHVSNGQS